MLAAAKGLIKLFSRPGTGSKQQQQDEVAASTHPFETQFAFLCNECFESILVPTPRYHCAECEGYDLCESCYAKHGPTHGGHSMYKDCYHPCQLRDILGGRTLVETVHKYFTVFSTRPCLGERVDNPESKQSYYHYYTYDEVYKRIQHFARGLQDIVNAMPSSTCDKEEIAGVSDQTANSLPMVGICSLNRMEWIIADFACLISGYTTVPVHVPLDSAQKEFILCTTESSVLIVGGPKSLEEMDDGGIGEKDNEVTCEQANISSNGGQSSLELCREMLEFAERCPALKVIISMEVPDKKLQYLAKEKNIELLYFGDVERSGAESEKKAEMVPRNPQDLYTLMFTSGSTGTPKGVMVTYGAWSEYIKAVSWIDPLVVMSMWPLAHMFDRKNVAITLSNGGRIGIFRGSLSHIFSDIALEEFESLKQLKRQDLGRELEATEIKEVESCLLAQYEKSLGGRAKIINTGGAATSPIIMSWLNKCFINSMVSDGYGTSEVGGVTHNSTVSDSAEVKLVDVPEMGYYTTDQPYPRGEIYVRTATMAVGYFKDPQATVEAFTEDGWFKTGDIGQSENGKIKIIDRKKSITKLAQGEFVAVERLEALYQESPLVEQIFVYGDSLREYLVAVVVPNQTALLRWAAENQSLGDLANDFVSICSHKFAQRYVVQELCKVGSEADIQSFEYIRGVLLEPILFSVDNGLLTGTMKVNRVACKKHYCEALTNLYEYLDDPATMRQTLLSMLDDLVKGDAQGTNIKNLSVKNLGIDSLAAVKFVSQLKEQLRVDVPLEAMFGEATVNDLIQYVGSKGKSEESLGLIDGIDFSKEYVLDPDIKPKAQHSTSTPPRTPSSILMTGATGFLGAFLLIELLQQSKATIYCIVRAKTIEEAKQKLYAKLHEIDPAIATSTAVLGSEKHKPRVQIVHGDLAQEWLGMARSDFEHLSGEVDMILHNGAAVNSVLPYSALKVNMTSTQWLLRLACMANRPVTFHHISTIGILACAGPDAMCLGEDDTVPDRHIHLAGGYSQSKYVAERLVLEAQKRGLTVQIYRPGRIAPHSISGYPNPSDFLILVIRGIVAMGCAPKTGPSNTLNLAPVDFVSRIIAATSLSLPNNLDDSKRITFHIVDPNRTSSMPFSQLIEVLVSLGHPIKVVPFKEWQAKLLSLKPEENNPLYPMRLFFQSVSSFPSSSGSHRHENLLWAMQRTHIGCPPPPPPVDESYVRRFVEAMTNTGALPKPPPPALSLMS